MTIKKWKEGTTEWGFREDLRQVGIADTRIEDLDKALCAVHHALCKLDTHNMNLMKEHFPEAIDAAKMWVRNEPFLNKLTDC